MPRVDMINKEDQIILAQLIRSANAYYTHRHFDVKNIFKDTYRVLHGHVVVVHDFHDAFDNYWAYIVRRRGSWCVIATVQWLEGCKYRMESCGSCECDQL